MIYIGNLIEIATTNGTFMIFKTIDDFYQDLLYVVIISQHLAKYYDDKGIFTSRNIRIKLYKTDHFLLNKSYARLYNEKLNIFYNLDVSPAYCNELAQVKAYQGISESELRKYNEYCLQDSVKVKVYNKIENFRWFIFGSLTLKNIIFDSLFAKENVFHHTLRVIINEKLTKINIGDIIGVGTDHLIPPERAWVLNRETLTIIVICMNPEISFLSL